MTPGGRLSELENWLGLQGGAQSAWNDSRLGVGGLLEEKKKTDISRRTSLRLHRASDACEGLATASKACLGAKEFVVSAARPKHEGVE